MMATIAYRLYEYIITAYENELPDALQLLQKELSEPLGIPVSSADVPGAALEILNYCRYNRMTDRLIGAVLKKDGRAAGELKDALLSVEPSIGVRIIADDEELIDDVKKTARKWGANLYFPSHGRSAKDIEADENGALQEAVHCKCDSYILILDKHFKEVWPNSERQWRERIYEEYANAHFRGLSTYILVSLEVKSELDTIIKLQKARWPGDTVRDYSNIAMLHKYLGETVAGESNPYELTLMTLASNWPEQKVIISYAEGKGARKQVGEIKKHLNGLKLKVIVWDQGGSGMSPEEMADETKSAIAAVQLVSADYVENENVRKHQLPIILRAMKRDRLKVLRLILTPVNFDDVNEIMMAEPLNDERPLGKLRPAWREEIFARMAQEIASRYRSGQEESLRHERQQAKVEGGNKRLQRKRGRGEFDVFISYNSVDKDVVEEIATRLEQEAYLLTWLDREVRGGEMWVRVLEQKIQKCKCAAVFIGAAGIGDWQHQEIALLLNLHAKRGKNVVPVLLKDAARQPELPGFLGNLQHVDWKDPRGFERLRRALTSE